MTNNKRLKVIIHPGNIPSKHDNEIHFISAGKLIELYGVLKTDAIVIEDWNVPETENYREHDGWLHLFPLYEGNYYNIHE